MRLVSSTLTLLAALSSASAASANPMLFGGTLAGANVVPPNSSPGTGTVLITLDPTAQTFQINASFSDLTGLDTAVHIHCCSLIQSGAGEASELTSWPGFPLSVTEGKYSSHVSVSWTQSFYTPTFISVEGGVVRAEAALVSGIGNGDAWFGIHTTSFPNGEIGTQLFPVPEPATALLFGAGFAGSSGCLGGEVAPAALGSSCL